MANPIIPGQGVCDPHIHIFEGRAFLYASHDRSPENRDWLMEDWQIWSSDDLLTWHLESVFRPESTYIGPSDRCWAVDAAQRNGKYFLYFSNKDRDTGVAVSDEPGRGFRDALGSPILPADLTDSHQYDPTVFIDDDATPYLIWGSYKGSGYHIARLDDSMTALAEKPRQILIDGKPAWDDKNFLHKKGDFYYLSWASHYAVSPRLEGPYVYRGNLGASEEHGSFFSFKGQDFFAFGTFQPTTFYRGTGLAYVNYRNNGDMVVDQVAVVNGVGSYDALWQRIEATWYLAADGVRKRENSGMRFEVVPNAPVANVCFPGVRNLNDNMAVSLYVASVGGNVHVEVHEGNTEGPLLGEATILPTGSLEPWGYRSHTIALSRGTSSLCFVLRGGDQASFHWAWFQCHERG